MTDSVATILVVDDESANRKLLELLLQPEGYLVLTANSGEDALAAIAQRAPDLLLLDIMMPGIDGYQVARTLKADPATSDIPIIIVTALGDRAARMAGLDAGAEEFLTKPVDRIELCLRVRNMLRIKAYNEFLKSHSAVLEQRVQERTADLSASETRFRQMADSISEVFYLRNTDDGRMLYVSPAYQEIFGRSCESLYAAPHSWSEAVHPDDRVSTGEKDRAGLLAGRYAYEYRIVRPDGAIRWIETKGFPVPASGAKPFRVAGIAEDITLRKLADERIKRLNRVYAMLSGITTLMVREHERDELFREVCSIAIKHGKYLMAWVGMADRKAGLVRPIAWAGDVRDFLDIARMDIADTQQGRYGMAGRAVQTMKPAISNDVANDPRNLLRPALLERGIHSLAIIPLLDGAQAIGVLALYAEEVGAFDEKEMLLLQELSEDISFAVANIGKAGKLARMTRVNAMLSGVNGAIVRIRDRQPLFDEVCRIAVEIGGLPFAFLCVVDEAGMRLQTVAFSGRDDGILDLALSRLSLRDDAPDGHGIGARSVRDKRAQVANNVQAHPGVKYKQAHAARGINAIAALPLLIAGRAIGAITFHAAEAGFFDDDEMKLLAEMVANIAFALEHIEKEAKVRRLTRVYAVLSGINALIVRTRDRDELFREVCQIATEAGGFTQAWVALVDRNTTQLTIVESQGGKRSYLDLIPLSLDESAERFGLAGRAVLDAKAVIVEDMATDPRVALHREAAEHGLRSLAILPLVVSDAVVGVLALYATETAFFNDDEMKLLAELAGDIAFAISTIQKQEHLEYIAYYDVLTGLANRTLFLERISQSIRSAAAAGHKLAVFLIDLERFKNINDSLGRLAGDTLLTQVARWLILNTGDAGLLARVGTDHFALLLPEVTRDDAVARLLEKKMAAFMEHPFQLDDAVFRIAAKVGAALYPDDGRDADTLLRNAEAALKKAKARGDRYLFYTQQMNETVAAKLSMENQLRVALDNDEFVLHYQPKVSLASGKLTGAEALIRWNDPRTGLVPPGNFIPILEETGLIYNVGRWALRKAVADYLRWRAAGLFAPSIAVNVSPLQLRNRGFLAEIQQAIGVDSHAAAGLELEITENVIMGDIKNNIASLKSIRAMGVSIAIDDFGTGFSSLSYLASLPVDTLKIDRSFVTGMTADAQGLSLVSTIISLAHAMKLTVVAEGVETEEQAHLLRLLRCNEMQGFLFSKAVPHDVFEAKFLVPDDISGRTPGDVMEAAL